MFTSSWRLLAVFLPHKQVVKLKKAGTAALFFLAVCCFYFYSACLYVTRYALFRFFPRMQSHIPLCCLEISAASLVHSVLFQSFSGKIPPRMRSGGERVRAGVAVYLYFQIILCLHSFSKPKSKDGFSCGIRISPYQLGVETLVLDFIPSFVKIASGFLSKLCMESMFCISAESMRVHTHI